MSVKIKLKRIGARSKPVYRLVIQESRFSTRGDVIEIVGTYNPRQSANVFEVSKDRIQFWLGKGAQPTQRVRILLGKAGVMPMLDLSKLTKKKPKSAVEEKPPASAAPAAETKKEEAKAEKPATKEAETESKEGPAAGQEKTA